MMRNFLVESMMLVAESLGLDISDPVFTSEPIVSDVHRERAGYVVEAGTVGGHRRSLVADVATGGRLVSTWQGMFDLDPQRDGMEGGAKVVVTGEPSFEVAVRGDLFLDTYPPTGARAMAAVRPLRALPPGLHTVDELAQRPAFL